jgi:hypothetical protein
LLLLHGKVRSNFCRPTYVLCCAAAGVLCAVLQSTWSQLVNFACEYAEDEKLLMDTFQQQKMRSNVVTIRPEAAVPAGDAARFRDYGVLCTLDEVRCAQQLLQVWGS